MTVRDYGAESDLIVRDEFHSCLWDELPGAGIISNWATTEGGSVDYYVPDVNWLIELLCDGEGLEERFRRFRENKGVTENLKDWLILDCRHSVPDVTCKWFLRRDLRLVANGMDRSE